MLLRLLLMCLIVSVSASAAQEPLKVRDCGKLPFQAYGMRAAYDGQDSIYIMGGVTAQGMEPGNVRPLDTVVKYTVTTGVSSTLDNRFAKPVAFGGAITSGDYIYYFGPSYEENGEQAGAVWRFSTDDPKPEFFGELNKPYGHGAYVKGTADFVYIFGGMDSENQIMDEIVQYNLSSAGYSVIGHLDDPTFGSSAVYEDPNVYLFGGATPFELADAVSISRKTTRFVQLSPIGFAQSRLKYLPYGISGASAVVAQQDRANQAYLIGGNWEESSDDQPVKSRLLVHSLGGDTAAVPILNTFWDIPTGHTSVYVERNGVKVIYTFGGYLGDNEETDQIMCIELPPSSSALRKTVSWISVMTLFLAYFR